ncbi:MAG: hypothetical protein HGA67_04230 [Candidatus Yonathbacteria bacterium]|nr:hypothetical protein [Candidatus Yonathbacteria bacterium]
MNTYFTVPTGCHSSDVTHPCNTCGRLHWPDGNGVFNRQGHRAFCEKGTLVNKPVDPVNKE